MVRRRWSLPIPNLRLPRLLPATQPHQQRAILIIEGILLMLGLWAALTLRLPGDYDVLVIGKPSPFSIQAPRSEEFVSDVRTDELRAQAENRPENLVYNPDLEIPSQQRNLLDELLTTISSVRNDPTLSRNSKIEQLTNLPSAAVKLSSAQAEAIVTLDDAAWSTLRSQILWLYDKAMAENDYALDEEKIRELRERSIPYWMSTRSLSSTQHDLALFFTSSFFKVNRILDEQATQARKRAAAEAVEDVIISVQEGESIVRQGEIVTPAMIEKLERTGALPQSLGWYTIAGRGLLCALMAATFMIYLVFFQPMLVRQPRSLLVIILVIALTALSARLLLPLWVGRSYAFPLATIALVFAVVFNARLAMASVVLLSLVLGIVDGNTLTVTATMLLSSMAAVFVARSAERMLTFLLAGLGVAAVTVLAQIAFWMASSNSLRLEEVAPMILPMLFLGGLNGAMSAILSLGMFNLVGRAAGVVTPMQLMELAHPSQPLLRKLIREAPGTYYHSVAVSNLAEAAAETVGADALLLRVAAYYHDIGKTIRPYFFTDNQTGRENVHNDLDPFTSTRIIVDHVSEGVKMAETARIPQQIIDFISTHHGTHLIKHFYQQALQQQDTVDMNDYRYPGPKPSTREQGILMLADSVEATVRSKAQNGKLLPARSNNTGHANDLGGATTIDELVGSIIDERLRDGQLDNTPLTLRDLILIRQSFVTSLQSIYHPRVDYTPQGVKA